MTRIRWDEDRPYELGLSRGVFYPTPTGGVPWNGLTAVDESYSGFDAGFRYIDGVKIQTKQQRGEFAGTVSAFSYPEGFYSDAMLCTRRVNCGFSYQVTTESSIKIHLVYNVLFLSSEANHERLLPVSYSWDFSTKGAPLPYSTNTAHLVIDVGTVYPEVWTEVENILYGSSESNARMPSPEELYAIFESHAVLQVIDHGDGSFTVTGPDSAITMLDSTSFEINWPSAIMADDGSYRISSF